MGPGLNVDPAQDPRDRRGARAGGATPVSSVVDRPVARDSRQPCGGGRPAEAARTRGVIAPLLRARLRAGSIMSGGGERCTRDEKEQVVAELTERLRTSETLIVADYRGLTNSRSTSCATKLIEAGARFAVVKNTLTRRAAEAAGADALLALLEGPTAIAFIEATATRSRSRRRSATRLATRRCSSFAAASCRARRSRPSRSRSSPSCRRSTCCAARCSARSSAPLTNVVGAVHGPAAEPRRADRRPDRAARGAGRHVGARRRCRGGAARAGTGRGRAGPSRDAGGGRAAASAESETETNETPEEDATAADTDTEKEEQD